MAASLTRPFADRRFRRLLWLVLGSIGWAGLVGLGAALIAQHPPRAGFDLTLVLDAGRRVAAGSSPYLPGAVNAGTHAEGLFYAYPPPVAQFAALVGGLPDGVLLLMAGLGATLGFGAVAQALAGVGSPGAAGDSPRDSVLDVVLPAISLVPFTYPFAIALLFGNFDAWFPLAYGGVLLAVTGGSRRWRISGGIALGLVTIAKLHPGALLGWLAIRGLRAWKNRVPQAAETPPTSTNRPDEGNAEWAVLAAALATIAAVVAVSLAIGGPGPWADYLGVLRAGSGLDLVTDLNIGPASQIALLAGDPGLAPRLAPFLGAGALAVTAVGAWVVGRTTLSLAIAASASLVVSPITWFHYPVALVPFAVGAWVQGRGTPEARRAGAFIAGALIVAGLAIAAPVVVWLSVALVVAAISTESAAGSA